MKKLKTRLLVWCLTATLVSLARAENLAPGNLVIDANAPGNPISTVMFFNHIAGSYAILLEGGAPPTQSVAATVQISNNQIFMSFPFCTAQGCMPGYILLTPALTRVYQDGNTYTILSSNVGKAVKYTWTVEGDKVAFKNFQTSIEHIIKKQSARTPTEPLPAGTPRYRLQVGTRLDYTTSATYTQPAGTTTSVSLIRLWVVAGDATTGWRVLKSSADKSGVGGSLSEGLILPSGSKSDLRELFPPLPTDAADLVHGWAYYDANYDQTYRFSIQSETPNWTLTRETQDPAFAVFEAKVTATYRWNADAGIMTLGKETGTDHFPREFASQSETTFTGKIELDAPTMSQLTRDFAAYVSAQTTYATLRELAMTATDQYDSRMARARQVLVDAEKTVTFSDVRAQFETDIANHDQLLSFYQTDVTWYHDHLNQPAQEWNTSDLDGHAFHSKDYQGKVSVIDFWESGCNPCMHALPHIQNLAQHFRDHHDVAFFGMNIDSKLSDPRHVISTLGITFPTLQGGPIAASYSIFGFPTILVVDKKGIIRKVYLGFSMGEERKLQQLVDQLAAE